MKKIKNILITGGNGRIGKSLTNYFLSKGHRVVCGDKKFDKINYNSFKQNLYLYKSDLTNEIKILNFIKFALRKINSIDVFFHCSYPKTSDWGLGIIKLNQKSLNKNLNDQLGSTIIFLKHLIKYFIKKKGGNIILFSSIYGCFTPNFNDYKSKVYSTVEYSAIKAGIISTTKYLAKLYKKKGLRINCISPGGIIDNQESKFIKNYKKHCNSKGMLDSTDINGLANFLISDESNYINGQNLVIDDGWSL